MTRRRRILNRLSAAIVGNPSTTPASSTRGSTGTQNDENAATAEEPWQDGTPHLVHAPHGAWTNISTNRRSDMWPLPVRNDIAGKEWSRTTSHGWLSWWDSAAALGYVYAREEIIAGKREPVWPYYRI